MAVSNPINLKKAERSKTKITGEKNYFPTNLSDERSIIIKIFDTSNDDPNAGIARTASGTINVIQNAFADNSKSDSTSTFESLLNNAVGTVKTVGAVGSSALTAADTQIQAYKEYAENFKDFGNAAINQGADSWMDNIFLPLPNEITESLSHSYAPEPGFMQKGVVGGGTSAITTPLTAASNAISKATGKQALVANENKVAMFESSEFRSVSFNWTLIPNNAQESLNIQKIITKLKAYSSPQAVAGKLLLRAPFFCQLEFPNKVIDNALQFRECVITNIEVNYSVTGNMETFLADNMPKTMSLSITFQDREPKTLQAWADGQEGYEFTTKEEEK